MNRLYKWHHLSALSRHFLYYWKTTTKRLTTHLIKNGEKVLLKLIIENFNSSQKAPKSVHAKIIQFDFFLSVLEQKRLENHKIYYIGSTE